MSEVKRKFTPEETERNLRAAYALLEQRRAAVNQAYANAKKIHEHFIAHHLYNYVCNYGDTEAEKRYRKARRKVNSAQTKHSKAVEELKIVENAIRRVTLAEHEVALLEERQRELNRPKKMVQVTYDPNWTVPGPNEILEARKWWD